MASSSLQRDASTAHHPPRTVAQPVRPDTNAFGSDDGSDDDDDPASKFDVYKGPVLPSSTSQTNTFLMTISAPQQTSTIPVPAT